MSAAIPYQEEEIEGIDCSPCCRNERFKFILVSLILGQILSLCLCGTGVASQFLEKYDVDTPTTQSFVSYFLLCLVYGTLLACRPADQGGLIQVFRQHWWKYAILAFIDVEANYLVIRAYQYTNLASIQLLDCFTIPVVLVLSFIFLYVRYLLIHIVGVAVCLIGIGCLVWGDIQNGKGAGGSDRLIGDVLCLSGAALYGVSNVAEEMLVKKFSRVEYLGMLGLFGSVISGIQLSLIERKNLSMVKWQHYEIIVLYLAFAACMFTFYSLVTVVIRRTSAAMYNLNILTADFYTLIAGLLIFGYTFHYLYFVSFVCVLIGSIIYSLRPTESRSGRRLNVASTPLAHQNGPISVEYLNGGAPAPTVYWSSGGGGQLPPTNRNLSSVPLTSQVIGVNTVGGALDDSDVVIKICKIHGPVKVAKSPKMTSSSRPPNFGT